MDLRLHPRQPAVAFRLASYLNQIANLNAAATAATWLREDNGPVLRTVARDATPGMVRWWAGETAEIVLVVLAGCSQLAHSQDYMAGCAGNIIDSRTQPVNATLARQAGETLSVLEASGFTRAKRTIFAGHSLGGAIAEVMIGDRITDGLRAVSQVCTFGAPKPGNSTLARLVDTVERARWMSSDDPVPILPPTVDDTPFVLLAYALWSVIRFGNFVHPSGGISINPQGQINQAVLPPDALLNVSGSLAGWLLAIDGSSSSGHHITSYMGRLSLWLAAHPTPVAVPQGGPREQPNATGNSRIVNAERVRVTNAIRESADSRPSEHVQIPDTRLVRVRREGALYLVVWNENVIATASRRRTAQGLARRLNDTLRSLQHQPLINLPELRAQLTAYLDAAASPSGGFSPVLATSLDGFGTPPTA